MARIVESKHADFEKDGLVVGMLPLQTFQIIMDPCCTLQKLPQIKGVVVPSSYFIGILGVLLVAFGVFELFTQAGFVPELLRFEFHEFVLIGVGILLMLPLIVNIMFQRKQTTDSM